MVSEAIRKGSLCTVMIYEVELRKESRDPIYTAPPGHTLWKVDKLIKAIF